MARTEEMDDARLSTVVGNMVKDAEDYRNERSADREKMMVYYDGQSDDMQTYIPADEGRSRVVSRDVRAAVRKVLPSVLRTILGNDNVVEYTPVGEGDEETADQASDYVNHIALPECNGRQAIEDAINDAIRLRNGVIKWWCDYRTEVKTSRHTGLDELSMSQLIAEDEVEVLEHTERAEQIDIPEMGTMSIPVHDLKIRRTFEKKVPKIDVVAPENFLIDSEATSFGDAAVLGEHLHLRRSDLVKMGYDRDTIWGLPIAGSGDIETEAEEDTRRRDVMEHETAIEATKAMEEVDYYDLLVKVDYDGDGIAELRRLVFAGGFNESNLLENLEWDEVNYANIYSERRPHQWEGNSITDEVMEIEKVKTVLLRQTLDNLYWQNNLQPSVEEGAVLNPDALLKPEFGKPIRFREGTDVTKAMKYNEVPFTAKESFGMLEYMDNEVTERTGISDASSGMAPDALQNMTAKASAMMEQAGIGQTEMMVRCLAESLKPVFRGLLKLVIEHQDVPRTVRLRGEWVKFDPRSWNAEMDATVNIGLGAGTRERDMMMMQQVIGLQREILSSMGQIGREFVTPENLYNAINKLTEAAGLRSTGLYFTEPDPQQIEQIIQQQAQQPSDEEIKAQKDLQLEKMRQSGKMQVEAFKSKTKLAETRAKMQADASKEQAQMDADLTTELQKIEAEAQSRMEEALLQAQQSAADNDVEIQKSQTDAQVDRERMATDERIAEKKIFADLHKDANRARMQNSNRSGEQ